MAAWSVPGRARIANFHCDFVANPQLNQEITTMGLFTKDIKTTASSSWQSDGSSSGRCLDQPKSPSGARLRTLRDNRRRLRPPRNDPSHAQTLDQAKPLFMNPFFVDRL
jgi:hypothetical protein